MLAFMRHAGAYYVKDGKPSAEVHCFKSAIKPLVELYGLIAVYQFATLALKAVRQAMIDRPKKKMCRSFINKSVNRIRHLFRWAVENGMASVTTLQGLQAVSPLKAGKCDALDHQRREAVSDEHIEAVRQTLSQHHRDLFDLLRATGARPSELLGLSMADINTTGEIWVADLTDHKNAHRGLSRKLFLGPKSQLILRRLPAAGSLFTLKIRTFSAAVKRACIAAKVTPFVTTSDEKEPRSSFVIRPARELIGTFPEIRPSIIEGLLRRGETMNIIAPPKTGKSWMSMGLGLSVVSGRKWLGRFWTRRGKVLIVDNELHPETSAHRLPSIAKSMGIQPDEYADRLFVANIRGQLIDLKSLSEQLIDLEAAT